MATHTSKLYLKTTMTIQVSAKVYFLPGWIFHHFWEGNFFKKRRRIRKEEVEGREKEGEKGEAAVTAKFSNYIHWIYYQIERNDNLILSFLIYNCTIHIYLFRYSPFCTL